MRTRPNQDVIEARVVKRFNRLHEPLLNLIQALHDMIPDGSVLSDKVEFKKVSDHIRITYGHRPLEVTINDGNTVVVVSVKHKTTDKS